MRSGDRRPGLRSGEVSANAASLLASERIRSSKLADSCSPRGVDSASTGVPPAPAAAAVGRGGVEWRGVVGGAVSMVGVALHARCVFADVWPGVSTAAAAA